MNKANLFCPNHLLLAKPADQFLIQGRTEPSHGKFHMRFVGVASQLCCLLRGGGEDGGEAWSMKYS